MLSRSRIHGFTLAETLVVIAIVSLISALSLTSFASLSRNEALSANTAALATRLRDARARTLASVGGTQYGVKIATTSITFFRGASYDPSTSTNDVFSLSNYVNASSSIQTIIFERLTGNASASGTIEMYLVSNPSIKKTVMVQTSGLVNVQ
jgi:prepilin-type N-terminal cleavage/methylation domain-containing protein